MAGPSRSSPRLDAIAAAPTAPSRAAATFVTFWIANWTANSSLRWSGSLCSVRNGAWTTWSDCWPTDHSAAKTMISGSAWVSSRPTSATRPIAMPAAMSVRRPNRSDAALAGNATTAPATDAHVETTPIVAFDSPSDARYRLKSIQ